MSLTVINSKQNEFSVAIIPYTIENTTFKDLKLKDVVNLEFDVIGKYVSRIPMPNFYSVRKLLNYRTPYRRSLFILVLL